MAPALTLALQGIEIFSGQPRTKRHWFFSKYIAGIPKGELDPYSGQVGLGLEGCHTIVLPTNKGLPYQTEKGKKRLEQLRQNMSLDHIWERDYLCKWISNADAMAFDEKDIMACVKGQPSAPRPGHRYLCGHDLGGVGRDNGATLVWDATAHCFVYARKFKQVKHHLQVPEVVNVCRQYGNCVLVVDATGGGNPGDPNNYARMYKQAYPNCRYEFYNQHTKPDMVLRLRFALESRAMGIPSDFRDLIDELCTYECINKGDRATWQAMEGMHDDFVSAAMLCLEGERKHLRGGAPLTVAGMVNR